MEGLEIADITLGEKYRDGLLQIEGYATAKAEYLGDRASVCLEYVADGKAVDHWVNIGRVELVV